MKRLLLAPAEIVLGLLIRAMATWDNQHMRGEHHEDRVRQRRL